MQWKVFKLEIATGNDAMTTASDVAELLEIQAQHLRALGNIHLTNPHDFNKMLFDVNGNTVGHTKLITRKD